MAPLNRRLVYASLTAYGETGPEADTTGFDHRPWAPDRIDGFGAPGPQRHYPLLPGMGDHPTGVSLMAAIAMGLLRRERTGEGGQVSTSLVSNGVWMNAFYAQAKLAGAEVTIRPHRDFATKTLATIIAAATVAGSFSPCSTKSARPNHFSTPSSGRIWPTRATPTAPAAPPKRPALTEILGLFPAT